MKGFCRTLGLHNGRPPGSIAITYFEVFIFILRPSAGTRYPSEIAISALERQPRPTPMSGSSIGVQQRLARYRYSKNLIAIRAS
jgi:hypothetical protein